MRLYPILIVLLSTFMCATAYTYMSPNDPVVAPGHTLVVNCTVAHKPEYTPNDVWFFIANQPVDRKYYHVVDDVTMQLRYPNITTELNQKFMTCKLNKTELIGMQILTVKIQPVVPRITKCVVHKSIMRCKWSPTALQQTEKIQLKVTDKITWKRIDIPGETWQNCSQDDGQCVWPVVTDVHNAVYRIRIETRYEHDNVSGAYTIKLAEQLQVDQVKVSVRHLNASSVMLEWDPVSPGWDVVYRITFSESAYSYENVTKLINTTHLRLDGLTPYHTYTFIIDAKTRQHGYWSKPAETTFTTLSYVPARNPEVKDGGYSVSDNGGSQCVEVTVYWKPVVKRYQHGPDFHYEVNVTQLAGCDIMCSSQKKVANHVVIEVSKNCHMEVTIASANLNGMCPTPPAPVRVVPASSSIHGPSNLTVIASEPRKEVVVTWNQEPSDTATSGYTFYWTPSRFDADDSFVNWQTLPADKHQVTLPLSAEVFQGKDLIKYEFAVSREEGQLSSGMVISTCTHRNDAYSSPPPGFMLSKAVESKPGSLSLEWKPPSCNTHRGFVYAYELWYCETETDTCPEDPSQQHVVYVKAPNTEFVLTGLTPHSNYCVTIKSVTGKGPSQWKGNMVCAVVPAAWWTKWRIIGFTLGGLLVFAVVVFGIIRFGRHCHKLYSKFQRGINVELPRTSYSTQFSVSSNRELIDQNYFNLNVEDFSSPGLAKQHSQESTADSGRGSMTQDHIHHPVRRSNSGGSDEVFYGGRNALVPNGTSRSRQASEPMGSYARVLPDTHSGSIGNQGTPFNGIKPKLPPRKGLPFSASPGSLPSLPRQYDSSVASGSIPSYVMVGDNSQTVDDYKDNSVNSSPISDYTKAKEGSSVLNYITPEIQSQADYITAPQNQGAPHGYVTGSEVANQGAPLGYVTGPQAANQRAPLGYVTGPQVANQGAPLGYVTGPGAANQGSSLGYVTGPQATNQEAPLGYVTGPQVANQEAPLGYVTGPQVANQEAPLGYVTGPQVANQEAPLGYVTGPQVANQEAPVGYVTGPQVANQGAPLGYVTGPHVANQGAPLGYVTGPQVANKEAPLGYVPGPEAAKQGVPLGYVTSPEVAKQAVPDAVQIDREAVSGYVASPEQSVGPAGPPNSNPNGYVSPEDLDTWGTIGAPQDPHTGVSVPSSSQAHPAPDSDYVKTDGTSPPLAVSTPLVSADGTQGGPALPALVSNGPVSDTDRDSPSVPQASVESECNADQAYVAPKGLMSRNSDANHNDVANTGSYVQPAAVSLVEAPSESTSLHNAPDAQTDLAAEDTDETCFLLPSDGGRKVLNKSGYVVVDT